MLVGLSAYNSSSSEDEEEIKVTKRKKKIFVSKIDHHSSDEETEPTAKKPNLESQEKTSSGLFSKLPPPRNTIGSGKESNRTFIPYVFTKKSEAKQSKVLPKKAPKQDSDSSDDDKEEVNFFSFVDKQSEPKGGNDASTKQLLTEASSMNSTKLSLCESIEEQPSVSDKISISQGIHKNYINDSIDQSSGSSNVSDMLIATYNSVDSTSQSMHSTNAYLPPSTTSYNTSPVSHQQTNLNKQASMPVQQDFSNTKWQENEQFKRLQGRANRREKIEFIEVSADSALVGNKELLLKQISEEKSINRMSHSKKRNSDMPSSQSRRKHQLSYLIHQAKEREIELKNAWAEGHAARQAARNRYGF